MTEYIRVAGEEGEDEIEFPTEEDGTLLLSTLIGQFCGASGLNFRSEVGTIRAIRLADNKLHPPSDGWGDRVYLCAYPRIDVGPESFFRGANISTSTQISNQSFRDKLRSKLERSNISSGNTTCVSNFAAPSSGSLNNSQSFLDKIKAKNKLKNGTPSNSAGSKLATGSSLSVLSSQTCLERILKRNEQTSSTSSSRLAFNSTLKNLSIRSKDSTGNSDLNSEAEMELISQELLKMKKMYKETLMMKFIAKSMEELVLENPTSLPENIVRACETNILNGKLGHFASSKETCDNKAFSFLFNAPSESLTTKDSQILETKLVEFTSNKCKERLAQIDKVNALGLGMFIKEPLVKPGSILTDQEQHIISSSHKIKAAHDKCKQTAIKIIDVLQVLGEYRAVTLPNLNLEIAGSLVSKTKSIENEIRSFSGRILRTLLENNESLPEAMDYLLDLYQKDVYTKTYELSKLKKQREEYDAVKGPIFDELISQYLKYKQVADQKESMLEFMRADSTLGDISYVVSDDD